MSVRVLIVGGLTRLDAHYRRAGAGVEVDAVYVDSAVLEEKASAADAIVLVLGHVSHPAAAKVKLVARRRGTPVAPVTSPSVSRVRATVASVARAAR